LQKTAQQNKIKTDVGGIEFHKWTELFIKNSKKKNRDSKRHLCSLKISKLP
jgi:hypothetical protein